MLDQYRLQADIESFTNIMESVKRSQQKSGVKNGICVVYCPHMTTGVTVNKKAL